MVTNRYFNQYNNQAEQRLLEDLVVEAIRIHGHDLYYLPRTLNDKDELHGEDDQSSYDAAYMIDMYIKSVDGFQGQGVFMSKFMAEVRDQVIFTVARRTFDLDVGQTANIARPREGDLLYFPANQRLFAIQFVNNAATFYPHGALQTWDLTCELFEYSSESFNTGIEEIDSIQLGKSINILDYAVETSDGYAIQTSANDIIVTNKHTSNVAVYPIEENDNIQTESDQMLDFSSGDPFSANGVF